MDSDIEKELMVTKGERWGEGYIGNMGLTDTHCRTSRLLQGNKTQKASSRDKNCQTLYHPTCLTIIVTMVLRTSPPQQLGLLSPAPY